MSTKVKLSGKLHYAEVTRPCKFNDEVYNAFLQVDAETSAKLVALGAKPSTSDFITKNALNIDGHEVYRLKRKVEFGVVPIVDSQNGTYTGTIGNGSTCVVDVSAYEWNSKFGKGTSLGMNAIQILDLIEFIPDTAEVSFDKVESGFVAATSTDNDIPI